MPRVFISYSSQDKFEALAFRDWLFHEGWAVTDVFLDLDGISAGEHWKEALAKANERCEAVVLLASPASLASTECRVEIRMAENYGKEIVIAIIHTLRPDSLELDVYRERQIVDLSLEPRDASFTVGHNGLQKTVAFHRPTLVRIKARLDQLGISPASFPWRPSNLDTASPYPGLKGFEFQDAALFFGRAGDIARGLAELRKLRRTATGQIMVIQAASGAGKSSFLKAGLWPRLSRDPEFVPLAILRPAAGILTGEQGIGRQFAAFFAARKNGAHRTLTAAAIHQKLSQANQVVIPYLADLINAASEIGHATQSLINPDAPPPTPLIAVDQAEELFAAGNLEEGQRFLELFASLIDPYRKLPDHSELTVAPQLLWTLRADSVDALLEATEAAALKPPALFALPPIPRDAYRDIIESPLDVANTAGMKLTIDPLLVNELVAKSTGADALPLLAFALRQFLADNRAGAAANLTLQSFEAAGGMEGVIAARLTAAQCAGGGGAEALRRLFLPHLATWDGDAAPPGAKRLIAQEEDLTTGSRADLAPLIEALVNERLLTRSIDDSGVVTLEVAHEALLRQPPLSDWLEADRDFLIWRENLARARASFDAGLRGRLVGKELQIASDWMELRLTTDITETDRSFIIESLTDECMRRDAEEKRELEHNTTELLAAKARKDAIRASQRAKMLSIATMFAACIAIIVGGVGWFALTQKREAQQQARIADGLRKEAQLAQSQYLTALSMQQLKSGSGDPVMASQLALEALPDQASTEEAMRTKPYWPRAETSLIRALGESRELAVFESHNLPVFGVTVTSDGARIITHLQDRSAQVWGTESGAKLATYGGDQPNRKGDGWVSVSSDGAYLVTWLPEGSLRLWETKTGSALATIENHKAPLNRVSLTSDGSRVIAQTDSKAIQIFDSKSGTEVASMEGNSLLTADGNYILTDLNDSYAKLWRTKNGEMLNSLKMSLGKIVGFAITNDHTKIVTYSTNKVADIWDIRKGIRLSSLRGHDDNINGILTVPGGNRILTWSQDRTARVWDVDTGVAPIVFKGHTAVITSVALTADGTQIVTGSADNTARLWQTATGNQLAIFSGSKDGITSVAITPDGNRVITGGHDATVRVWESCFGVKINFNQELNILTHPHQGNGSNIISIATTSDGSKFITGSEDKLIQIWDIKTGKKLSAFKGHDGAVTSVAATSDGAHFITGSADETIRIWDSNTLKELKQLKISGGAVIALATTLDGSKIAASSIGISGDYHSNYTLSQQLNNYDDQKFGATLRGKKLESRIIILDAKNGSELASFDSIDLPTTAIAMTPDGGRIFAVTRNAIKEKTNNFARISRLIDGDLVDVAEEKWDLRLWDVNTRTELPSLTVHGGPLTGVTLGPDGNHVIVSSVDGVRVLDSRTGQEKAILRSGGQTRVWGSKMGIVIAEFDGNFVDAVATIKVPPNGVPEIMSSYAKNPAKLFRFLPHGQPLIDMAKSIIPRCMNEKQRNELYITLNNPSWCVSLHKWIQTEGCKATDRRCMISKM